MPTRTIHALDVLAGAITLIYCGVTVLFIQFGEKLFPAKLGPISDYFGHASQACNVLNVFIAAALVKTYPQTKPSIFDMLSSFLTIAVVLVLGVIHWLRTDFGSPMSYYVDAMWWNAFEVGLLEVGIYIWGSIRVAKLHP